MFPYFHFMGKTVGMYGLFVVIGVWLTALLSIRYYKKIGQPSEDIYIVGACCIGFAMIFGNLLYIVVTYPFSYILSQIRQWNFSFLGSGIVFYGGLIGGIGGALLGARVAKCRWDLLVEAVVPFVPLGHAFGRVGCLLAGCCHGIEYNGPFAIYYSNSLLGVSPTQGYFPVQPLEAIANMAICMILVRLRKCNEGRKYLLLWYLSIYALVRFGLEFLRGDLNRGIYFGLSLSQWISLCLFFIGVLGICIKKEI